MPLKTGIMDLLPKLVKRIILYKNICLDERYMEDELELTVVNNITLFLRSASHQRTPPCIRRK